MSGHPIHDALARTMGEIDSWFRPATYHHNQEHQGEPMNPSHLIAAIEDAAHQAGHAVDQALHDVLTGHLTEEFMAQHIGLVAASRRVMDEAARMQGNPLIERGERLIGAPQPVIDTITHLVDVASTDLQAIVGPAAPAAEPAPVG